MLAARLQADVSSSSVVGWVSTQVGLVWCPTESVSLKPHYKGSISAMRCCPPPWPAGRLLSPLQKARGVCYCLSGAGSGQRTAVYPDLVATTRAALEQYSLLAVQPGQ